MNKLLKLSKQRSREKDAEHQQALDDVKNPLKAGAEFAPQEIPNIEAAGAEFYRYKKTELDPNWEAFPAWLRASIGEILFKVEALCNVTGLLRQQLAEFDALTWEQCWGNRADGERDRNRAANVRGGFNFTMARGCARDIREHLAQIKFLIAEFLERPQKADVETIELKIPSSKPIREFSVLSPLDDE